MDCLIDYIGLKECGTDVTPSSGIFINSLPGINTELLQKIADNEQRTYKNVWGDIQKIAAKRFYASIINELRKQYQLQNVREELYWSPVDGGTVETTFTDSIRGIYTQFYYNYYTFQAFTVAQVFLYSPEAEPAAVLKIQDQYGNILYTKTLAVVQGLNVITVDKTFSVEALFIGFDFGNFNSQNSVLSSNDIQCFCEAIRRYCGDCTPIIDGYTYSAGVYTKTANNTHGVGFRGYVRCDYNSIVCFNKELFLSAWMYLLGNQLMVEALGSTRIVQATTVDREKYKEIRDFYQVEYELQLKIAAEGIHLNTEYDCCIECNENPKQMLWLP